MNPTVHAPAIERKPFRTAALTGVLAAMLFAATTAQAAIVTITGDTTGKATFARPFEDLSGISPTGTGVHYDAYTFTVSVAGNYSFLTTGTFDTFTLLYKGSFLPTSALTNAVIASDDLLASPFTTSGFASTLAIGTTYVYVTTGFDPTQVGAYSTTIGGPGVVSAVPELPAYALMGLGLVLVGVSLLHRREQASNG